MYEVVCILLGFEWGYGKTTMINERLPRALPALALALGLGACGNGGGDAAPSEPVLTAATLGEQTVLSAADNLAAAPYASADRDNGERLALACRACHTLEAGGANMIGPNLHGFFGREVAALENYDYSQSLREHAFVWTPRALDAWLKAPSRFLPGNRMSYPGVPSADDRADLIAYLLEETDG